MKSEVQIDPMCTLVFPVAHTTPPFDSRVLQRVRLSALCSPSRSLRIPGGSLLVVQSLVTSIGTTSAVESHK
jgi:hypothetical protein